MRWSAFGMCTVAVGCGRLGFEAGPPAHDAASCDPTGVDVIFDEATTMVDRMTEPATAPSDGERVQLSTGTCPTFTGGMMQPYRAYAILNRGAHAVTVSAWASCVSGDLAVLTFYRRATPPVTIAERMSCAIAVTDSGSPDVGSAPCPGLLASAGRGLPLASCEVAIVWLQAEGGTLPTALHLHAE